MPWKGGKNRDSSSGGERGFTNVIENDNAKYRYRRLGKKFNVETILTWAAILRKHKPKYVVSTWLCRCHLWGNYWSNAPLGSAENCQKCLNITSQAQWCTFYSKGVATVC